MEEVDSQRIFECGSLAPVSGLRSPALVAKNLEAGVRELGDRRRESGLGACHIVIPSEPLSGLRRVESGLGRPAAGSRSPGSQVSLLNSTRKTLPNNQSPLVSTNSNQNYYKN